jgi:ankyrin repeat protein
MHDFDRSSVTFPLHGAANAGDIDAVEKLINEGHDINERDWVRKIENRN